MNNQKLFNAVSAHMRDGIAITDFQKPDNPLVFVNAAFERMTGYSLDEVLEKNCRFLQGEDTDPEAVEKIRMAIALGQPCLVTILNYRKDGSTFWNELSLSPILDETGTITHFVGIQRDVTTQVMLNVSLHEEINSLKSNLQSLEYLVNNDPLTGVYNRRYFEHQLNIQWKIANRQRQPLTIFMIDIDHYKAFNDTYGHTAGDQVLRTVAATLKNCFSRGTDFVGRYGGEEFIVLALGMTGEHAHRYAVKTVKRIEGLRIPHSNSDLGYLTISLGYSQVIPHKNIFPITLVEQADAALYNAKSAGKNKAMAY